jgi:hypothetical protein
MNRSGSLVSTSISIMAIIIVFVVLLFVITKILLYTLAKDNDPVIIQQNMKDAREEHIIDQDPNIDGSKAITRSVNKENGIEFSYSVWIKITELNTNGTSVNTFKPIFYKGNGNNSIVDNKTFVSEELKEEIQYANNGKLSGINYPDNAPGLYLVNLDDDDGNNTYTTGLMVIMNTFNNLFEHVLLKNIALNKWLNIVVRVKGKYLDVYINGTLAKRKILKGIPKQNYGNIHIGSSDGFTGKITSLVYYNKAVNIKKIQDILKKGPNTSLDDIDLGKPPYLSSNWYF